MGWATEASSVPRLRPEPRGFPSVDPVYTWLRLARRVPVSQSAMCRQAAARVRHDGDRDVKGVAIVKKTSAFVVLSEIVLWIHVRK